MKSLNEKINNATILRMGYQNINESWINEYKQFGTELRSLFSAYEKAKQIDAKPEKKWNGPHAPRPTLLARAAKIFKKYPIQILIEKAKYEPKTVKKWFYGRNGGYKDYIDWEDYAAFILKEIETGNLNKDDMIKWWREYAEKIAKEQWFNIKYIVKQIDPTKCWNPFYPKDDGIMKSFYDNPGNLVYYFKKNQMTYDNRKELANFLNDPVNKDALTKALKGAEKSILKARPSFATGAAEHIKDLISRCDYSDGDLEEILKDEYKANHNRRLYQGSNDVEGCEGKAVVGLILKVINQLYGFEVWHSMYNANNDEDSYDDDIKQSAEVRGEVSDETLEGFLNDADNLKFIIKKLGVSKKGADHSSVWSSSFWTYYNYDFDVICKKGDEEVFHQKFENITTGSSYYSGGWN
jgi:hypothetical protein